MSRDSDLLALARRERQVMDILFRVGEATVAEIMAELPDPPTYSAVRSILRVLGEKGLVHFREDGPRYVYFAAPEREVERETALSHVVRTYFDGSVEQAVTALLRSEDLGLDEAEVARLRAAIRRARERGRDA